MSPLRGSGTARTSKSNLLVIMAKEPVPGLVKTRLQPQLRPEEAAELARCFLQDRLEEMHRLPKTELALAYAPAEARSFFASLSPVPDQLLPQQGEGLEERLSRLFERAFAMGFERVAAVDCDTPDLSGAIVGEAFSLLEGEEADVVFGPCEDGGYYLVALKGAQPELFREIPWSTGEVLSRSLENAARLGLKSALLPRWRDIDTFEDLRAFSLRRPDGKAAHTEAYLRSLGSERLGLENEGLLTTECAATEAPQARGEK